MILKRLIRWYNDIRTGYIRLRFCERCGILSKNIHWSKDDYIVHIYAGEDVMVYEHIWLCDKCFYGKFFEV